MPGVDIGGLLKSCRLSCQLSQQDLADILMKDRTVISRIENGQIVPDVYTVMDWAAATNSRGTIAAYIAGDAGFEDMIRFKAMMPQFKAVASQMFQMTM